MPTKLTKISPIERAIDNIDQTIQLLRLRKEELAALLPDRPRPTAKGYLTHPITGERCYWRKKEVRRGSDVTDRG